MGKAKASTHGKPATRRSAFKDPIMDGMRAVGKALADMTQKDIKFILDWANGKFLDETKD